MGIIIGEKLNWKDHIIYIYQIRFLKLQVLSLKHMCWEQSLFCPCISLFNLTAAKYLYKIEILNKLQKYFKNDVLTKQVCPHWAFVKSIENIGC